MLREMIGILMVLPVSEDWDGEDRDAKEEDDFHDDGSGID